MKPARRIEDLTAQVSAGKSLLARAAAELGAWPAKAAAMVEAALVNARADHQAVVDADRELIQRLGVEYRALERDRNELKARVAGLQHRSQQIAADLAASAATIESLEASLATAGDLDAEFERRAKALATARSELEAIVGTVRDRMRRREREQADAALNRAALTSAVPGFRRAP